MEKVNSQSKSKTMRKILFYVLLFALYLGIKNFVWDVYIVNPTPADALKNKEGVGGIGNSITPRQNVTIRPYSDGFKIFGISKGTRLHSSWDVTDELFLTLPKNKTYEITERTIHFKSNKSVHYLFVATNDPAIESIHAYTPNREQIDFSMTRNDAFRLYNTYIEKPISQLKYQATMLNGEVVDLQ